MSSQRSSLSQLVNGIIPTTTTTTVTATASRTMSKTKGKRMIEPSSDDDLILVEPGTREWREREKRLALTQLPEVKKSKTQQGQTGVMRPASSFAPSFAAVSQPLPAPLPSASTSASARILPPPSQNRRRSSTQNTSMNQSQASSSRILPPPSSNRRASSRSKSTAAPIYNDTSLSFESARILPPPSSGSKRIIIQQTSSSTILPLHDTLSDPVTPKAVRSINLQSCDTPRVSRKRSLSPVATIRKRSTFLDPNTPRSTLIRPRITRTSVAVISSEPPQLPPRDLVIPTRPDQIDWSQCDPLALPSLLFRLDYLKHGNLDYAQAKSVKRKYVPTRTKRVVAPSVRPVEPSWANSVEMSVLCDRLDHEEFTATCWAKDLIVAPSKPSTKPFERPDAEPDRSREFRRQCVNGVEVNLLGLEFPLRMVLLVGTIVAVDRRIERDETNITSIVYTLDDSTSTIDCVCPLAPPTPRLCLALQRALDTGSVATPPVVSPPSYYEPFRVGTLVRVVGEVVDGMYLGAPKRIVVAKIEFVDDPNVEFLHHFIVAQTHAEVYSKPFDVATRLNRMIAAERDEQMEWKGSQMTESVAGSPTKTKQRPPAFPAPKNLIDDAITLEVFIAYITDHLRQRHAKKYPAEEPSVSLSPFNIDTFFAEEEEEEKVIPVTVPMRFSIEELKKRRSLNKFAELLAQKRERERCQKQSSSSSTLEQRQLPQKRWVNPKDAGYGLRATMNGGISKIIPPPRANSSKGGLGEKGKQLQEQGGMNTPLLEGTRLAEAISLQFTFAVRRMMNVGQIVTAMMEMEERSVSFAAVGGIGEFSNETELQARKTEDKPWFELELSQENAPDGAGMSRTKDSLLESLLVVAEEQKQEEEEPWWAKPLAISPPKKKAATFWSVPDSTDDEEEVAVKKEVKRTPTKMLASASMARSTTFLSFFETAAYTIPGEPAHRRMLGIETEVYEIVEPATLMGPISTIVRNQMVNASYRRKVVSSLVQPVGVTEEAVRVGLAKDDRWREVCTKEVVKDAITLLVQNGQLKRLGGGLYRLSI